MNVATIRTVLTTPRGLLGVETMQRCTLQTYTNSAHPGGSFFELVSDENGFRQLCAATPRTKYPELGLNTPSHPTHIVLIAITLIETPYTYTCKGNLRCPICLDFETQTATQYICTHSEYPMDALLFSLHTSERFNV